MSRLFEIAIFVLGCACSVLAADASKPLPSELTLDLSNNVAMKLVLIPPGKFIMGSKEPGFDQWTWGKETPPHEVTLSKPFYMAVYPLTTDQMDAVTGIKSKFAENNKNRPARKISWSEAVELCKKLSEKANKKVQLPTEAQWEYACRAGSSTQYSFGDDASKLNDYAWTRKNTVDAKGELLGSSNRVRDAGQLRPNAWGLYDMHGNVRTWCADWYGEYSADAATDPQGPSSGKRRIARGGSYYDPPERCTSAARWPLIPEDHRNTCGVRVVVLAD